MYSNWESVQRNGRGDEQTMKKLLVGLVLGVCSCGGGVYAEDVPGQRVVADYFAAQEAAQVKAQEYRMEERKVWAAEDAAEALERMAVRGH